MAQGSRTIEQQVVLRPTTARELGDLISIDISTATSRTIKEMLRTLSNHTQTQPGTAERYPQVDSAYYLRHLAKLAYQV